ncbi:MAG: hypothetical protein Kapaf2KO_23800 [Candidatus Kapaibacteriales bacterium]
MEDIQETRLYSTFEISKMLGRGSAWVKQIQLSGELVSIESGSYRGFIKLSSTGIAIKNYLRKISTPKQGVSTKIRRKITASKKPVNDFHAQLDALAEGYNRK